VIGSENIIMKRGISAMACAAIALMIGLARAGAAQPSP
jgi:hypothetical protein